MSDLERARLAALEEKYRGLEGDIPPFGDAISFLLRMVAAARREGEEAEREKVATWMILRSIPTGHGDTVEDLLAELRASVAEEMRERAASATAFCCFECSRVIRALPLTLEERE